MEIILIFLFAIGYITITLEHPLKLDKTVPALIMAAIMWGFLAVGFHYGWFSIVNDEGIVFNILSGGEAAIDGFENNMLHHFGKTAEILIFLVGAMTIVEIIDLHQGFEIMKRFVRTQNRKQLLWIIGTIGFLLSAVIDNLTTTIVLITIIRKLVPSSKDRMWYASLIIIAANAGGAWSPMGDVTTTMLWIDDKVTTLLLIENIVIPALACFLVPFGIASFLPVFQGNIDTKENGKNKVKESNSGRLMLTLGILGILSVPITKTFLHIPPYLGMMLALGVVWLASEYIHPDEEFSEERKHMYSATTALSRIEMSSILFFLGILMAVAVLETMVYGIIDGNAVGTLRYLAEVLQDTLPNQDIVIIILGFVSAVIDNVPLVAASMGMYDMSVYPTDSFLWHFIAYSAGTGGSMLIIGSAAGVAAMGMEKIDFIWYLKNISWLALLGFLSGAGVFLFIEHVILS
ncbi:MAG TPA: sodium:proton antiporter NhaD [Flavobacteriaceae bacterium]|nr:sodium:proton antiporter NhaD [Flavobacteriaceae bacterium]